MSKINEALASMLEVAADDAARGGSAGDAPHSDRAWYLRGMADGFTFLCEPEDDRDAWHDARERCARKHSQRARARWSAGFSAAIRET